METSNCKFERLNNLLFQGEALGLDLSELRLKLEEVVKKAIIYKNMDLKQFPQLLDAKTITSQLFSEYKPNITGTICKIKPVSNWQNIIDMNKENMLYFDHQSDGVEIVRHGLALAAEKRNDYVLIDTAGRLEIDEKLMNELVQIKDLAQPTEILLVVDAMTGQVAADVAKKFNETLEITGVIITKLDGDTRGGAALSIREITGKPIKFVGTGEKLTDLEVFYPDRMSSRILGMGDMLTLIEKAQSQFDEAQSAKMAEKMRENSFDFNDFIEQLDQVQSMGPLDEIMKMIPGMSEIPGAANIKVDEKDIARKRAAVLSMTPEERANPDILSPSRRRRIAAGSGNTFIEVNKLIKQFNESKKMMSGLMNGDMGAMLGGMGGQMPNMPGGMPDMSTIGDMGGAGMPDMSAMFGGGLKGKVGKMAMTAAMKRAQKKMKKGKKKKK